MENEEQGFANIRSNGIEYEARQSNTVVITHLGAAALYDCIIVKTGVNSCIIWKHNSNYERVKTLAEQNLCRMSLNNPEANNGLMETYMAHATSDLGEYPQEDMEMPE